MNKNTLIESVKKSKLLYKSYYFVATLFVNFLKTFVKTDNKLILFVSYGGRYFNDSPKSIYDAMKKDKRFSDYKLVWAFREPDKFEVERKIRIDTIKYYITALSARCWVTNVIVERALDFKGKNTLYFHTTHGTLPKLSGNDVANENVFGKNFKHKYDISCAQSEVEKTYQLHMFDLKPDQVLVCGYPKNDCLANVTLQQTMQIRKKLGIPNNKKVILYAPTFREDNPTGISLPLNLNKWKEILGEDYVVLFRAHPIISDSINFDGLDGFFIDVSKYPDNVDLMIASDILVSDYSGIFFEFAILNRPMYCFAYDYDEYIKTRGLYFDIRKELPGGFLNEEDLLKLIKSGEDVMVSVRAFANKYVTEYGHATEKAVNVIFENISPNSEG